MFTALSALWGYWELPTKDEDNNKTKFTSHIGTFRYIRMPFGLPNAPAKLQRALDIILSADRWKKYLVSIDDVVIFSENNSPQVKDIDKMLTLLRQAGMTLKLHECHIFQR